MYEVLAQLMEDMLNPQPTESDKHKGGAQSGRNHGQMNQCAVSIMQFHLVWSLGHNSPISRQAAAPLKMKMPKHQCFWRSRDIAKEVKPESTKGNHHAVCADVQKHRGQRATVKRPEKSNLR
jgi:hypothetical protein